MSSMQSLCSQDNNFWQIIHNKTIIIMLDSKPLLTASSQQLNNIMIKQLNKYGHAYTGTHTEDAHTERPEMIISPF